MWGKAVIHLKGSIRKMKITKKYERNKNKTQDSIFIIK